MNTSGAAPGPIPGDVVSAVNRAYARAVAEIDANHRRVDLRSRLAEAMIDLARLGERDEDRLYRIAMERTLRRLPS